MEAWEIGFTALFIIIAATIVIGATLYKERIIEWQIRRGIKQARREYLVKEGEAIQKRLCERQLTIHIDEELDEMHRLASAEYEKKGMVYHWYPESSSELIWLNGLTCSFDIPCIKEIISTFCGTRYFFIYRLMERVMPAHPDRAIVRARYDAIYHILTLLTRLLLPITDRTTRKEQRRAHHLQ